MAQECNRELERIGVVVREWWQLSWASDGSREPLRAPDHNAMGYCADHRGVIQVRRKCDEPKRRAS
jgi:hypothetical protein